MLEPKECPSCGKLLRPRHGVVIAATDFNSCLRRCTACGVGLSNAQRTPTIIYERPEQNVFPSLGGGLEQVLGRSVNKRNRANKRAKFCFSTSEDAFTWSAFRYLEQSNRLAALATHLGVRCTEPPQLFLWGVSTRAPYRVFANNGMDLYDAAREFREKPTSITEPDVILSCGGATTVFIEVKVHSPNEVLSGQDKLEKYVEKGDAYFAQPKKALKSRHYELVRNWVIGSLMAGSGAFVLVNLGPASLFDDENARPLTLFTESLNIASGGRKFVTAEWESLLDRSALFDDRVGKYLRNRLDG